MMKRRFPALLREEGGSTLIEFAFALPVLVMFIIGVLQIGMMMQANSALREVIGWGGREAMVSYQDTSDGVFSDTTIENMIIAKATDDAHRLKADNLTVDVAVATDPTLLVRTIRIDLDYDLEFAIPLWDAQVLTLTENRTFYVPM